ncbi:alpha-(1-_3)-arabinofuranosyltransferase family protein [Nocardioides sp.]|uniref:alpha-(1->3)-arabinofuranosyltransferase domain-containing protein n=1 Tax=Nocardioides sp. TaxID=35761 RepID=UPI0027372D95|nr:alpha-(1->3)-arabinofuranosyltransferase family protein [Nocardioides sp.]MDP3894606.1 alpha-(1->3)-arabinofuranosyltransferase family protein [Nocardioides sp.]
MVTRGEREGFVAPRRLGSALAPAARGWPHGLVWALLVALSFRQRPGETTFDTKLNLTTDPGAFLERSLHLWNPDASFGELQNQAHGYLFPQGSFALLGELLGLDAWVVQRLWSALLLVVAYEGARRLLRAVHPAYGALPQVLAGLAFALSPRLLGAVGVLTGEVLPAAVLPWVVLPLVLALRGRLRPVHGAALSGVAVVCMGGVNGTATLAALPLPALVLLCALGAPVGRRLALWWVPAVTLACSWWLLPLLVMGRYSPPFLDWIETAAATTRLLGWTNITRGADHWLAFIVVGGEPWWPGAYALATSSWLIVVGGVVAALGFLGLVHHRMPMRLPLLLSALLGVLLLAVGHEATLGSPLSGWVRDLLDGPLAPLRNVHKVDPLVRLPLALGLAHAGALLVGWVSSREGLGTRRPQVAAAAAVGLVGLLAVSAQPMVTGDLRKAGWTEVPAAWGSTADYLAEHSEGRRALVLPGSGFGTQTWGWTIDEPLQGLARSPWVTRSQVPLAPGQTIRLLDALEERVQSGSGSAAFADALARAGVRHVVVRRDLERFASGAPSSGRVDLAISRSPGLTRVAGFGSTGFGEQTLIDVYAVDGEVPLVAAAPLYDVVTVAGGPEDIISALEADALGRDQMTVNSAEPGWDRPPDVVGDGFRLRERQFGRVHGGASQVMGAGEQRRSDRGTTDYPGVPGAEPVVASHRGLRSVTASSSMGYADVVGPVRPEAGPHAALDGTGETAWRSAPLEDPRGQWLEVEFAEERAPAAVDVLVGVDPALGVPVRRIRVHTDDRSSEHDVDPVSGRVTVPLESPVTRVRVTTLEVRGTPRTGAVAIRELSFPGLDLRRDLVVADSGAGRATTFVFRSPGPRRACVDVGLGPECEISDAGPAEEQAGMLRRFTVSEGGTWRVEGSVVATANAASARLLQPLGEQVAAESASVLADDPSVSGQFAVDGNPATPWLADPSDMEPSITLSWKEARTISRLRVQRAHVRSVAPSYAVVESGGQTRRVDLGPGSLGFFDPIETDEVTITFPLRRQRGTDASPLGVGELFIDGIDDLKGEVGLGLGSGAHCGLGPEVKVDGRVYPTQVTGRLRDVSRGARMGLRVCGDGPRLAPGEHVLEVLPTAQFTPTSLTLRSSSPVPRAGATRRVDVGEWGPVQRTVEVGAGPAALLRIPENTNAGWRAELHGEDLEAVRVDGWQQGYRLPAGVGGTVTVTFSPDAAHRTALRVGLAGVALLLLTSAWLTRHRRRYAGADTGLPDGLTASLPGGPVRRSAVVGVATLLGGVPVLVGAVLALMVRSRRAAAVCAAVLIGGASVLLAVWQVAGLGSGSWLSDPLAGAGIGVAVLLLFEDRGAR